MSLAIPRKKRRIILIILSKMGWEYLISFILLTLALFSDDNATLLPEAQDVVDKTNALYLLYDAADDPDAFCPCEYNPERTKPMENAEVALQDAITAWQGA